MQHLAPVVLAYLLGSVPFGFIAGRIRGVDIRAHGSGNTGATNTLRLLGVGYGIVVLILDMLKGVLSAHLGFVCGGPWLAVVAGLAAVMGHNWSIFLRLGGGKGVATSFGLAVYLMPVPSAIGLLTFVAVVAATRLVSLGSMVGALALAGTVAVTAQPTAYGLLTIVAVVFIFLRHRENLARIRAGTESRLELGALRRRGSR